MATPKFKSAKLSTPSTLTLRLPWPPSINHYWQSRVVVQRGKKPWINHYMGAAGRKYRDEVSLCVRRQCGGWLFTGRLCVSIEATLPDRIKRDLDNTLKATLDALTAAGVWRDDGQIVDLRVKRLGVDAPGWLNVTITEIRDPQRELIW